MQKVKILYLLLVFQLLQVTEVVSQEAKMVVESDFGIRDFYIEQDSIFYIKKRDVFLSNLKNKTSINYFIGGYGLKMHTSKNSNAIITASNELIRNVSSVRFYNKKKTKFDAVFYYEKGKILDFLVIPEAKLFVLSLTNKKIIIVDYQDTSKIYKTIELNLNALSRKLSYKNNILYFATDQGNVFQYDFQSYEKRLIYKADRLITDFVIDESNLLYATIEGEITKINLSSKKKSVLKINNNFVNILLPFKDDRLICGSWNGKIYVVDIYNFSIVKELDIHKRAILNLKKGIGNTIYSSSLDKTIKKWILN